MKSDPAQYTCGKLYSVHLTGCCIDASFTARLLSVGQCSLSSDPTTPFRFDNGVQLLSLGAECEMIEVFERISLAGLD